MRHRGLLAAAAALSLVLAACGDDDDEATTDGTDAVDEPARRVDLRVARHLTDREPHAALELPGHVLEHVGQCRALGGARRLVGRVCRRRVGRVRGRIWRARLGVVAPATR